MKNIYLNGVLNFRVYLCMINKQKQWKYIVNKLKKNEKKNNSKDSPHIPFNHANDKKLSERRFEWEN